MLGNIDTNKGTSTTQSHEQNLKNYNMRWCVQHQYDTSMTPQMKYSCFLEKMSKVSFIRNKPNLQEINYDFIKFCLALSTNFVALGCMNLKP